MPKLVFFDQEWKYANLEILNNRKYVGMELIKNGNMQLTRAHYPAHCIDLLMTYDLKAVAAAAQHQK